MPAPTGHGYIAPRRQQQRAGLVGGLSARLRDQIERRLESGETLAAIATDLNVGMETLVAVADLAAIPVEAKTRARWNWEGRVFRPPPIESSLAKLIVRDPLGLIRDPFPGRGVSLDPDMTPWPRGKRR